MNDIKFYKGESLSLVFSAYDKAGKAIDISGYTKEVSLFTPFSTKLVKSVTGVSNSSFSANITAEETSGFEQEGNLNIIVKLKKGTEVKIAKSIPFILLDPDSSGCRDTGRLSVDSGNIKIDMSFDTDFANFDVFFGNGINLIDGADAQQYINEATRDKADKVNSEGDKVVYAPNGSIDISGKADKADILNVSRLNEKYNYATKQEARNSVPTNLRALGQTLIYYLASGNSGWEQSTAFTKTTGQYINGSNGVATYSTTVQIITIALGTITKIKIRCHLTAGLAGYAFYNSSGTYISGSTVSTGYSYGDFVTLNIPSGATTLKTSYYIDSYATTNGYPVWDYVQILSSAPGIGKCVKEMFTGTDISEWSSDAKWEDVIIKSDTLKFLTGTRNLEKNTIESIEGDTIIENIDKMVYYQAASASKDITQSLLSKVKTGLAIESDGKIVTNTSGHKVAQMVRLQPNTKYTISGFQNTWGANVSYLYLYSASATDNVPSIVAAKKFEYSDVVDGAISFVTDDVNYVISLYIAYNGSTYPHFDSSSTIKLTDNTGSEIKLVDENGKEIKIEATQTEKNLLQTSALINSSFSLLTTDILDLTRDRIYKVSKAGRYTNIGASTIKTYRNGEYIGEKSIEISNNELKDNSVYFSYDYNSGEWSKIVVSKDVREILDVTNTNINSGWCWFGSPNFLYRDGKTFIGIVDGVDGKQAVVQYNHSDKTYNKVTLGTYSEKDDHNQPSFVHLSDGRILAVYCEHGVFNYFRFRVSINANDATSWSAEKTAVTPASCTYSHLFKLSDGRIINIFRNKSGNTASWTVMFFNESTLTFSNATVLHSSPDGYTIPYQDDVNKDIIHILCTPYHPRSVDANNLIQNVYYYKVNLSTNTAYKSNGDLIGNLPVNLLTTPNLDIISSGTNGNQWIEDIIVKYGKARVLYTVFPNSKNINGAVKHLMFSEVGDDGKWTAPILICRPMDGFVEGQLPTSTIVEPHYSVGASFDNSDINLIWCPIQVNCVMELHKVDLANGFDFRQCTYNSQFNQWRPITTDAIDGNKLIMWLDAYYYENPGLGGKWNQNLIVASEIII